MAAASAFEALDAEEAEDKDPIIRKECAAAARPAAEMPAAAALTPAAGEAPAPALPAALVLVQRPMTGGVQER